jgi:glucosamine--fructose-6-phosphate aminotransferase (isomerizing)
VDDEEIEGGYNMCGLIGYANHGQTAPAILAALKKLEYRGYDSAGVATISNSHIECRKDIGKLDGVQQQHRLDLLSGPIGIGHVRWATHGRVTQGNAHPHLDCHGEIAIVHNGIIENCQDLRSRLGIKHRFISNTDTEVIVHLIEEQLQNGNHLERAVSQAISELEGSYALLVISAKEPHKIVAARKDSPLVVGIGSEGNFIASDALCFPKETKRVIYIEDNEAVVITNNEVSIFDTKGKLIKRAPQEINWSCDEATKQGHDFFMLKEIMEQPEALRSALMQDKYTILKTAGDIFRAKNVVLTACGSSKNAALVGRYLLNSTTFPNPLTRIRW